MSKRGPKPKYPWREWLGRKGTVTTLTQGRHFDCAPHGFAVQARRVAARLKIRLGVEINYNTLGKTHGGVFVTLRNKGAA